MYIHCIQLKLRYRSHFLVTQVGGSLPMALFSFQIMVSKRRALAANNLQTIVLLLMNKCARIICVASNWLMMLCLSYHLW
jgi:hypothetical protein